MKLLNNQIAQQIVQCLWAGKREEARNLLAHSRAPLEAEIKRLQEHLTELQNQLSQLDYLSANAPVVHSMISVTNNTSKRLQDIDNRREKVITTARKIAEENPDKLVTAEQTLKSLEEVQFDLGVPIGRRTTTIAAILLKSSEFSRRGVKTYQYNGGAT